MIGKNLAARRRARRCIAWGLWLTGHERQAEGAVEPKPPGFEVDSINQGFRLLEHTCAAWSCIEATKRCAWLVPYFCEEQMECLLCQGLPLKAFSCAGCNKTQDASRGSPPGHKFCKIKRRVKGLRLQTRQRNGSWSRRQKGQLFFFVFLLLLAFGFCRRLAFSLLLAFWLCWLFNT